MTISLTSMYSSRDTALIINDTLTKAYARMTRIETIIETSNIKIERALNPIDNSYTPKDFIRDMPDLVRELQAASDAIQPKYMNDPQYEKYCNDIKDNANESLRVFNEKVKPLLFANKREEALQIYNRDVYPLMYNAQVAADNAVSMQTAQAVNLTQRFIDLTMIILIAVLTVISIIFAIIIASVLSNYIANSLSKLGKVLRAIESGDFTVEIPKGNKDEFGKANILLANTCNSLNNILSLTKQEFDKLKKDMRSLQKSSKDISDHASDIQSQSVAVAAASDEMVSTTADIARNCDSAATSSNTCREISDGGLHKVQEAVGNIRHQSLLTKDNASKIESLARQSNEIGSIVSTIDDIAAQTNLLALNAAIEAARAGEAGRGFAVVADEVRALASRTTKSTQEISRMVKNIQDEAATATASITSSVESMDLVADDATHIEDILNDINAHVDEVNVKITQIATAAEEQTTATGEISQNMQSVTQASDDMNNNAQRQNEIMESTCNDIEKLSASLEFFKTK